MRSLSVTKLWLFVGNALFNNPRVCCLSLSKSCVHFLVLFSCIDFTSGIICIELLVVSCSQAAGNLAIKDRHLNEINFFFKCTTSWQTCSV